MKNWKKFASMLLALVLCLCLAACGEAEEDVIVTVANQSGQDITSLSIAATTSDDWGEEFVHVVFQDGELMEVSLGAYKPSELPTFRRCSAMHGDELAQHAVISDDGPSLFPFVFQVLRHSTDDG